MADPRLEAVDLACERGERLLFANLDLTLEAGQVLRVEGQNGAGKTSLLRVLCGLSLPLEGEIRWAGEDIRRRRTEYLTELAYVGHAHGVKGELTALENLRVAGALAGHRDEPARQALGELGLAGFEELPSKILSAGQRRRVALARLKVSRARLWILDEPFTALDRAGVAAVEQMITLHARAGGLCLLTSHQPVELDVPVGRIALHAFD